MPRNGLLRVLVAYGSIEIVSLLANAPSWAQTTPRVTASPPADALAASVRELSEQVRELGAAVAEIRSEAAQYRAETSELRRELQEARTQIAASSERNVPRAPAQYSASPSVPQENTGGRQESTQASSIDERVARLEEESGLLNGKIDDQYQTKVESASKYRVRLSGIVLLNLFSNRGSVDNQDFPNFAVQPRPFDSRGNFGATLRQSELGLEVFGPRLAGARTTGNVQFDFAGGFPEILNGVSSGLVRMRTATMRLDWARTSVVAGQDNLYLSPLSPTSFASLAVPTFGYAGNLWAWVPQVRVEHRIEFSNDSNVTVQGGILDNLTGEPPPFQSQRVPQGGERSSQPGYAVRTAWNGHAFGQPLSLGVGGYYSRQDWGFNRHVDGWASTSDWDVAFGHGVSLSGEFYTGTAVGGFGGAIGRSVVFSGSPTDPASQVRGLDSIGGWSQLKFKATPRLEFNGAFALDDATTEDLRAFPIAQSYLDPRLARNRGSLANFIYRPRSNLLFSAEYRHLRTFEINPASQTADQINLVMGVLF
jgi:hypothetical protein